MGAQGKNKRNIAERNQIEIRSQRAGRVRLDRPIYLPKLATGDAKLCDDDDGEDDDDDGEDGDDDDDDDDDYGDDGDESVISETYWI